MYVEHSLSHTAYYTLFDYLMAMDQYYTILPLVIHHYDKSTTHSVDVHVLDRRAMVEQYIYVILTSVMLSVHPTTSAHS